MLFDPKLSEMDDCSPVMWLWLHPEHETLDAWMPDVVTYTEAYRRLRSGGRYDEGGAAVREARAAGCDRLRSLAA